jgi:hypothetical protein
MKRSLLNRFILALESGRYPQGRGQLVTDDGYCCMGVLCKIARLPNKQWISSSYPPRRFAAKMHMKDSAGSPLSGRGSSLVDLNDSGTSFRKIAARLRRNPRVYIREIIEDGAPVLGVKK